MRLRDLIAALRETYCGTIGAEYMYISDTPTKRLDPGAARADPLARRTSAPTRSKHILERLTAAETLERYLHTQVRRPEALLAAKAATA